MKPLVLDDHKSLFRSDEAFEQFVGAFEAKMREPGVTPIWGNDRHIGTALAPGAARLVLQDQLLQSFAADPALADDIRDRMLNDPIVD